MAATTIAGIPLSQKKGSTAVFADGSEGVYHVTVDFPGVNDPPTAGDDSYTIDVDRVLSVPAPGVLGNDSDPEGGALTLALVSGPVHGAVSLHPDGSFEYGPLASFSGTDQFTYQVTDAGGAESALATVPARPETSIQCEVSVYPATPATSPNTAPRPSLAP